MLRVLRSSKGLRVTKACTPWHTSSSLYSTDVSSIQSFRVMDKRSIPRLNLEATLLEHETTKAQHLHVTKKGDNNNVFSISFKTNPPDMSGLPHILEHTTLCGSQQYPVRDPFFKMLTRSLANFMNAMTGFDYTFYPFATTNHSDFFNLQSVYLDSVFNPLLLKTDFQQEGWRLEHEVAEDKSTPLIFKGVVYNEMKGQLSNPSYLYYIRYFQHLYPSLKSSGGEPSAMTALTHKDLVDFHTQHYHPSNSFTFSYSDLPLEEILRPIRVAIENHDAMVDFDNSTRKPIDLRDSNVVVKQAGPYDPLFDENKQFKTSVSWIVGDSVDMQYIYLWKIFSMLIMEGHSSPLHKALIDSGIATEFSVNAGLDTTPASSVFTLGVQGISEENIPEYKRRCRAVLEDIAENGFEDERLQAIINQAELSEREVDTNFGMSLVYRLFPRVFNGSSPLSLLDSEAHLNEFKAHLEENPKAFQNAARLLLSAPYFEFTMYPSKSFEATVADEEQARLEAHVSVLSDAQKEDLYKASMQLKAAQQSEEDVSVLPSLHVADIEKSVRKFPIVKGENFITRETGTQGLLYLSLKKKLQSVDSNLLSYVPLFTQALTSVGTANMSMGELEQKIRLHTGGLAVSPLITSPLQNPNAVDLSLLLSGASLEEKSGKLFEFFLDILKNPQFQNVEKLRTLIQSTVSSASDSLSQSGHSFAMAHSSSFLSRKRCLSEKFSGLEQLQFMKDLSVMSDETLSSDVVDKLFFLKESIINANDFSTGVVATSQSAIDNVLAESRAFVDALPASDSVLSSKIIVEMQPKQNTFIKLPFQVSYVGVSLNGTNYLEKDAAALQVLANLLTHRHLHTQIREKGGAYGGGASYSALDGIFSFYSYRDPNPKNTLDVVSGAGEWAVQKEWTDRHLEEAKLSIFQSIDAPMNPRSEISSEFLYGLTVDMRQQRRDNLLNVTVNDVKEVAAKYLVGQLSSDPSTTVLGSNLTDIDGGDRQWKTIDFE